MKRFSFILSLLLLLVQFFPSKAMGEDGVAGERELTPNEVRRIQQANEELPKDIQAQERDTRTVARLREDLRKALFSYQVAVHKFGTGTNETRQACHHVVDIQKTLHRQLVKEEAIPAITIAAN